MWATFVIFKKLTKVNLHPMGENSPNLVTLLKMRIAMYVGRTWMLLREAYSL
jgi:hypothetical protein